MEGECLQFGFGFAFSIVITNSSSRTCITSSARSIRTLRVITEQAGFAQAKDGSNSGYDVRLKHF